MDNSPPPPPPLPPSLVPHSAQARIPERPTVPEQGPPGCFLVELVIFNGSPYSDHWAYFIQSRSEPDKGVEIHATGDVVNGFEFQIKRYYDFEADGNTPTSRVPLQWVNGTYFNEKAMLNNGVLKYDTEPVCQFEASVHKIKAPGKSLNSVEAKNAPWKKVYQRNCQTWVVESADQLVRDGIFMPEIAVYLHAIKQ